MIALLTWLIMGHVHKWEDTSVITLVDGNGLVNGKSTHVRCTKCGEHEVFTNYN